MRKIVIGLVGVVAVSIALVLIAPRFVDWNVYREEIARIASRAIGRAVTIDGPVGLRLLPAPALSVADVRVAAPPGFSDSEMAGLDRLDVRIAPASLLSGRVQVENVLLVRPRVVVERAPSGALNWSPPVSVAAPTDPFGGGTLRGDTDPAGDGAGGYGLIDTLSFDQIVVDDARITYDDRVRGTRETVDAIDLDIVAGSVAGPFQVAGGATVRNVPIRIEATTGRFADGAAVPLRLTLGLPGGEPERMSGLRFAGIIGNGDEPAGGRTASRRGADSPGGEAGAGEGGDGAPPALRGDLRVETPDLLKMIGPFLGPSGLVLDPRTAEGLSRPFVAHTNVEASADRTTLGNLELTLGDTAASGRAGFAMGGAGAPRGGDLTLAVNRVDLDRWMARAPETGVAGTRSDSPVLPGAGFALPSDLTFRLDLSLDAAAFSGGVVRQVRLEAMLEKGALAIDRLSAQFPGGSNFASTGRLVAVGGAPRLDLRLDATSDNLRAALEWLGVDTARIPAERLRKSALTATIGAKPDRLELTDIDLELDTSRVTGAVAVEIHDRPAIGARLVVDNLNVDAYLPIPAPGGEPTGRVGAASSSEPASGAAKGGAAPVPAPMRGLLGLVDLNLDATLGRMTLGGDLIRDVRLDLTAAGGAMEVRQVSFGDWAGMSARIGGQAAGLSPLRNAHLTINASAESLAPMVSAAPFGLIWPAGAPAPESLGRTVLQARLAGDGDRLAVEGTLETAGATLELGGTVTSPLAFATSERSGERKEGTIDLTGRLRHPDADNLLALIGVGAPAGPGPFDIYAHLADEGPRAALSGVEGVIGSSPVAGEILLDRSGNRPRVEASLRAGAIDIDRILRRGAVVGNGRPPGSGGNASTEGSAGANGAGIDLGVLDLFDGNLKATLARLDLGGVSLDQFAATVRLDDGKLAVDRFDAGLMSGRVGGRAVVTSARGERAAGMTFAATAEGVAPAKPVPVGPLTLTGGTAGGEIDVAAAGPDPAAWPEQLTGTARIAVRDGVLRGIDLAAIRDLVKGDGRSADLVQGVARGLRAGETGFANLDGGFRIDHGVIETSDTRLESAPASVSAVGVVDLPKRTMDMTLTVDLAIDPPPPPISVRLEGPLGAPERKLDGDALKRMVVERAAGEALRRVVPEGSDAKPLNDVIQRPLGDLLRRLGR